MTRSTEPRISVVISTHRPSPHRMERTLAALCDQNLPREQWELVVVDNASPVPLRREDLPAFARLVREDRLGLTYGRLAGVEHALADNIVLVDDDNLLAPDYLATALDVLDRHPSLGLAGGRTVPEWEGALPEQWVLEFRDQLALRDLGGAPRLSKYSVDEAYPAYAPIGAGMVMRRSSIQSWVERCVDGGLSDRKGESLSSAGDCDIVMFAIRDGWEVGYFPNLVLTHLIPESRTTPEYLGRLNYGIAKSWVALLDRHGVRPWEPVPRWTLPLRKARAYVSHGAWSGPAAHVRWMQACGYFDGRAQLRPLRAAI